MESINDTHSGNESPTNNNEKHELEFIQKNLQEIVQMEGPPTCECLGMSKETSCQALAKFIKTQTKQPEYGFCSELKDLI